MRLLSAVKLSIYINIWKAKPNIAVAFLIIHTNIQSYKKKTSKLLVSMLAGVSTQDATLVEQQATAT